MILPIYVYGSPVLRKVAEDIDKDYPGLQQFIKDMFDTMYKSDGVGLAAPQVGKSIRLFVIDGSPFDEDDPSMKDFKKVFINAHITEKGEEQVAFSEGCLSLPNLREEVMRPSKVRVQYYDENWEFHDEYFEGLKARIVQHEYDHLDGILFVDKISTLKRKLLNGKLLAITKGKVDVNYKIRIPK
ncbi:MAG TPA: peptide deformylase [Bacteroidales bacterium]|nr:peptide deformylase [Bacteroidales bacterium]